MTFTSTIAMATTAPSMSTSAKAADIAVIVIGAVLLIGGFDSVVGIFFGTLSLAMVNQGIYFTDFDRYLSSLIVPLMLLIAIPMNNTCRKMAISYSGPKKK